MPFRARKPDDRLVLVLLVVLVVAPLVPSGTAARSLWSDSHNLVGDFRANEVGDQLTVLIVESNSGSNQSRTKTDKSSNSGFKAGPGLGGLDFIPLISLSGEWKSSHDGKGSTVSSNSVRARLTAQVTNVWSNGDLEIMGTRNINVNGEERLIRLTGVVRQRDITADNTVLSTFVGNAQIEYVGAGPVTRGQQIGWWKKILDWVF